MEARSCDPALRNSYGRSDSSYKAWMCLQSCHRIHGDRSVFKQPPEVMVSVVTSTDSLALFFLYLAVFFTVPVQSGRSSGDPDRGGRVDRGGRRHGAIQTLAQLSQEFLGLDRTLQGRFESKGFRTAGRTNRRGTDTPIISSVCCMWLQVGFKHHKDYVGYTWAKQEESDYLRQEHHVSHEHVGAQGQKYVDTHLHRTSFFLHKSS